MENSKSYTELEVWKKSRALVKQTYLLTENFPKEEVYSLTSQIKRSVISFPLNIAEGVARKNSNETLQFLYYSRGSLYELETQLILAGDLKYINDKQMKSCIELIEECKKLLSGFINYYKSKSARTTNH